MSFLDQLAKNLNTQTEFFGQLSNLSKNSRIDTKQKPELNIRTKPDIKANTEVKTKTKTESKNPIEPKEKEDFKVEKENFFSTAKKVFKQYKTKTDNKTEDKEDLQEELETVDEALDLIFGLVDPQLEQKLELPKEIDLTVPLQVLEVNTETKTELDPELLDFFLEKIDLKISTEIESLTKDIADLDLNTEDGIASILDISNSIEALQHVEAEIRNLKAQLENLLQQASKSLEGKEIKPELELLLETKVNTKLDEIKNLEIKPEFESPLNKTAEIQKTTDAPLELAEIALEAEEERPSEIKKVLDAVRASLKQDKAIKDTTKAPENKNYNVKVFQEGAVKNETNKVENYAKTDVEILELEDASFSETDQNSNFDNDNFETLFPREIKASTVRIRTLTKPVAIRNLPELITKETESIKTNTKQELKMILDPQNLGKMQLSITREDNQIHISMLVRSDEAATKLEQKVNDIRLALKEKGFESNIEVTKSDVNNSNESQQNQGHNKQENETKQEQKEKYLNQVPQWISDETEKLSFKEALNNIL